MKLVVVLLLALLIMVVIGFCLCLYAIFQLGDLQSDILNPHSLVKRLNPKLKFEAWLHIPMLLCWIGAYDFIGGGIIFASAAYRYYCSQQDSITVDPTTCFHETVQKKLTTRWSASAVMYAILFFVLVFRLVQHGPEIDMERANQMHESHQAFREELRQLIAAGNASWQTIMAHSMTQPGMLSGGAMML
mmetsp:Transcript_21736/g.35882  ORF Transcript_21736/g.35882 Transcript_21736/m.35882 type:complete len:189 (-) Transcript_21736:377-943(-)